MKKLLYLLLLVSGFATAQVAPALYYDFDQSNPLAPRVGSGNLSTSGSYQIVPAAVGNGCAQLFKDSLTYKSIVGGSVNSSTAVTVQMLFKAGHNFLNGRSAVLWELGWCSARFTNPTPANTQFVITFITRSNGVSNYMDVTLDGVNRKGLQWYLDSAYHQMVFVYNASSGSKQVFVDGVLLASATVSAGTIELASDQRLYLNENTNYDQFFGTYDEVAVYNSAMPAGQVKQNYDDFKAGQHYTTALATVPATPSYTANFDITDYPIGYTLGSATSAGCTYTARQQLTRYPYPRYPLVTTLLKNFNWVDPKYFAGYLQSGASGTEQESVELQKILYNKWNYMLIVAQNLSTNVNYADTNSFEGKWVKLANANTSWTRSAISFWSQINSVGPSLGNYIQYLSLPSNYYMTSGGNFILTDINGTVTPNGTKTFSPAATQSGLILNDGSAVRTKMQSLLGQLSSGRLDFVNENDEVFKLLDSTVLSSDPVVVADKVASGLSYREYYGLRQKQFSVLYRDTFMNLQPSALYTQYQVDGWDGTNGRDYYHSSYKYRRQINRTIGGKYYSTFDFYPRYPSNWRCWTSAWRGRQALEEARQTEIGLGDKAYSPFVSAGWDTNEELNQRPGRYLGEMKCLGLLGADFYYAGFFNEGNFSATVFPPNPKGYAWQMAAPVYSHAVLARVDTIIKTGLYVRDMLADPTKADSGYGMWAGDPRIWCVVRQDSLRQDRFVIAASVQPNSNQTNQVPATVYGQIKLKGNYISFPVRQQGSVYYYNSTTGVLTQLDAWHERTHPDRWNQDIQLEAEVADSSSAGTWYGFDNSAGTYLNPTGTEWYQYNVAPVKTATHYVWIYAKGSAGTMTRSINRGSTTASTTLDTGSVWKWYKVDSLSLTAGTSFQFWLKTTGAYVDKILFTTADTSLTPRGGAVTPCGTVTVTISSASSFCDSTLATASATAPLYYAWSNGATTASTYLKASGTYTVTVTNTSNCTGSSTVTVSKLNCDSACYAPSRLAVNRIYRYWVSIGFTKPSSSVYAYRAEITNISTGVVTYSGISKQSTVTNIVGLVPNTNYKIRIQTYCSSGSVISEWGNYVYFKTNR